MKYFKFVAYLVFVIGFYSGNAKAAADLFKLAELDNAYSLRSELAAGADPNATNTQGDSPLMVALKSESFAAAGALAAFAGTNVDLANNVGETPLMMAAIKGQLELCRQLIGRGAKVNRSGWTPLHYAASGGELAVVELMIRSGAVLDSRSPNRTTPLMMAASYGTIDIALLLLERGANPALRNDRNLTAADFALNAGREELAKKIAAAARQLDR